jgi:hypothetical protein
MTIHHLPPFGDRAPTAGRNETDDTGDVDDVDVIDDCDLGDDDSFEGSVDTSERGTEGRAAMGSLFDDDDASTNRFGGLDPSSTFAHRVVTPALLAGLTGVPLPVCQSYHYLLFSTLEDVGDFDGLIVAPPVFIGPRSERFEVASRWFVEHPAPDVPDIWADINTTDEPDSAGEELQAQVTKTLSNHSLGLAVAAGSNPSLTFGSADALTDQIIDDMFDHADSWSGDEIARLTDMTLAVIGCGADVVRLIGGARIRVVDPVNAGSRRSGRLRTGVRNNSVTPI